MKKFEFSNKDYIKKVVKNNKILSWIYYQNIIKIKTGFKRLYLRHKIKKNGIYVLRVVHKSLTDAGIRYFIDFGTLLGFIREGNFIKHDLDIDIGVIVDDLNTKTEVQDTLLEAGCTLKKEYIFQGNIVEQSYLLKDIKFDVGFYENTENNSICYLFYNESTIQLPPNKLNTVKMTYSKISEFRKQRFYNTDVIIPKNPEKLLEEKYGSTWMKPNENWVYWQAPNAEYLDELGEVVIY